MAAAAIQHQNGILVAGGVGVSVVACAVFDVVGGGDGGGVGVGAGGLWWWLRRW